MEAGSSPREYLRTLSTPTYQGETGWTPEDFLTHFITQLETTNQVSHDRCDDNALWLLGSYMPDSVPYAELVPTGYWARALGGCTCLRIARAIGSGFAWRAQWCDLVPREVQCADMQRVALGRGMECAILALLVAN